MKRTEQYTEQLSRLYPELHQADEKERILTQTVTFQVTDDCNLACTYCYQIKKGKYIDSLETLFSSSVLNDIAVCNSE